MGHQNITTIAELLSQLFLWSSLLALTTYGFTRVSESFRHWSALWKTSLILCFLPLFPWSYFDWLSFDWAFSSQSLLEYPAIWMSELGVKNYEPLKTLNLIETKTTNSKLFLILAILVSMVSLARITGYLIKLNDFKCTLRTFKRLSFDSLSLAFMSDKQRTFIELRSVDILLADGNFSPYVTGLIQPILVLPKSFFTLPNKQQILLFEHELTHIKHQDVTWVVFAQVLSCLFWFTPAIRFLRIQLEQSIEVECDARVIQEYPEMKKDYGKALLNVIKLTQQNVQPQTAFFIGQQYSSLKNRILLTQQKSNPKGINLMHKITLGLSALLLSVASWALSAKIETIMNIEEFLSIHKHATKHIEQDSTAIKPAGTWTNPVAAARLTSKFKAKHEIRDNKAHLGVDLAAKKGEPIVASSYGTVVIADDSTLHRDYGKVVVIDHGLGTLSMYLHMDSIAVTKGDVVQLGQSLGEVGETGRATGPHLHFEVITDGRHIDPASIIKF